MKITKEELLSEEFDRPLSEYVKYMEDEYRMYSILSDFEILEFDDFTAIIAMVEKTKKKHAMVFFHKEWSVYEIFNVFASEDFAEKWDVEYIKTPVFGNLYIKSQSDYMDWLCGEGPD